MHNRYPTCFKNNILNVAIINWFGYYKKSGQEIIHSEFINYYITSISAYFYNIELLTGMYSYILLIILDCKNRSSVKSKTNTFWQPNRGMFFGKFVVKS